MRYDNSILSRLLNSDRIRKRFEKLLDKAAPSFISSILSIVNGNPRLQECPPDSIAAAAGIAAALKLPINPSLGFAYIVPYNKQAQFQLGYRGFVQLAMRSGQYRTLNTGAVCEGQIADIDFVTGEIIRGEKISDEIVGYVAYMELLNGFSKSLYMSVDELKAHAEKYSRSYQNDVRTGRKTSIWSSNFNAMAKKTVFKLLLSRFGVMSIDPQSADLVTAIRADQAVVVDDGFHYVDNESDGEANIVPFSDVIDIPALDAPDEAPESSDDDTEDKND